MDILQSAGIYMVCRHNGAFARALAAECCDNSKASAFNSFELATGKKYNQVRRHTFADSCMHAADRSDCCAMAIATPELTYCMQEVTEKVSLVHPAARDLIVCCQIQPVHCNNGDDSLADHSLPAVTAHSTSPACILPLY